MGEAEGTGPHCFLFLVGAAAGCSCPRNGQSCLCRLEWRWHRSLAVSLVCTLSGWRVLLPQLLLTGTRSSGGRTAVPTHHVNALQIKSHQEGQVRYLMLQSSRLGRGILTGMGLWIWAPQFWCGPASVSCTLDLALSTVKPRPQKVNGCATCYWCLMMQRGNCQDFASCLPRNGAINDEECSTYCKFRLMLIWQLPSQGSLHASCSCKYSLFHEVAIDHPELIQIINLERI